MQISYFALFELEPRFALVSAQLDGAYRALVARVHPDRHAQSASATKSQAQILAATANEAYRTLKKPLLRARHLLDLRGVASDGNGALPDAFLGEQMDWRETLQDAQAARDLAALRQLAARVQERAAGLQTRLAQQLDTERDDTGAIGSVNQLMFLDRIAADIDDACARLED